MDGETQRRRRLTARLGGAEADRLLDEIGPLHGLVDELLDAAEALPYPEPPSTLRPRLRALFTALSPSDRIHEPIVDTRIDVAVAGTRGVGPSTYSLVFALDGRDIVVDLAQTSTGITVGGQALGTFDEPLVVALATPDGQRIEARPDPHGLFDLGQVGPGPHMITISEAGHLHRLRFEV